MLAVLIPTHLSPPPGLQEFLSESSVRPIPLRLFAVYSGLSLL